MMIKYTQTYWLLADHIKNYTLHGIANNQCPMCTATVDELPDKSFTSRTHVTYTCLTLGRLRTNSLFRRPPRKNLACFFTEIKVFKIHIDQFFQESPLFCPGVDSPRPSFSFQSAYTVNKQISKMIVDPTECCGLFNIY